MVLSQVKSGVDFEEYVADILEHSGLYVERTKKSHDYGADLIVTYLGAKYCIQCKWSKNPIGVSAVQEVFGSLVIYGAQRGVVVTNSSFSGEAKRLAIMNQVALFDGHMCSPYVADDSELGLDTVLFDLLR